MTNLLSSQGNLIYMFLMITFYLSGRELSGPESPTAFHIVLLSTRPRSKG